MSAEADAAPAIPAPVNPPDAGDAPFDAVVVVREFHEDGGVQTRIVLSGDVKATEVETILQLGLSGWRKQIGV